jgi:hypothetical protein
MRFMMMPYSTDDNEAGVPASPEQMAAIGGLMQEYATPGVLLGGEGVHPSSKGAPYRLHGWKCPSSCTRVNGHGSSAREGCNAGDPPGPLAV